MGGLCNTVTGFASLFIVIAFVVALVETGFALWAKLQALRSAGKTERQIAGGGEALGPVLEALAKVLAALKDLPAWVAIFLAGLALAWTAISAPGLCPA
jgi:hypothetical protein